MNRSLAALSALALAISLTGCGTGNGPDPDDVLAGLVSDPVKNVNASVYKSNADADWLKHIKQVDDGSFDGIEIKTDLPFNKDSQYTAVDVCEAYTGAMQTPGMVEVIGVVPDIQMDGSDSGDDAKLAGNLAGGFFSDVKASETCVRDTEWETPILDAIKPFPANTPVGVMPDLVGVGLEAADQNMTQRGFDTYDGFDIIDATGADRAAIDLQNWMIVRQDPQAGADIKNATKVKVYVKKRSE